MDLRQAASVFVWLPILGGCMGMVPGGHPGPDPAGYGSHGSAIPVHAEASNEELAIAVSLQAPRAGAVADIDVRLVSEDGERDGNDREVRLRIRTPTGSVDELPMQQLDSSSRTYHATYGFPVEGSYLVTAEGRTGTGAYARTASVTTRVDVGAARVESHSGWMMPMAVVGGLGMIAMMAVMIWH